MAICRFEEGVRTMQVNAIKAEIEAIAKWLNETQCPYTAVVIEQGRVRLVVDDESAPIIFGRVAL